MHAQGVPSGSGKVNRPMPATDDEIREKYLERAIRELNLLTRDIQACDALPPRRADAGARLRAPAGRHHAAQVRAAAVGDRGGRRLLRPRRRRADEVAAPPADRPARGLRHAVRQVPGPRHLARRPGVPRPRRRGDRDRLAQDHRHDGRGRAVRARRPRRCRWPGPLGRSSARSSRSRRRSRTSTCRTSTARSTTSAPSAPSGRRSGCSATGTPSCRRTERGARRSSCRSTGCAPSEGSRERLIWSVGPDVRV